MDPYDIPPQPDDPWDDTPQDPIDDLAEALPTEPVAANPPRPQASYGQAPGQPLSAHRIEQDLTCLQCGYNLRGQLPSGNCSECGSPISLSLRSDQLSQSHPGWLGKLKQGMTWMIAGIILAFLIMVIAFGIGIATAASGANQPTQPGQSPFFQPQQQQQPMSLLIFGVLSSMLYAGVYGVAYWLITEPEPGAEQSLASRSITRWTILPSLALGVVAAIIALGNNMPTVVASQILQFVNLLLICVGVPASLIYLRTLALRVPDPGLAQQTSIVLYGLISVGALFVLTFAVMMISVFSIIGSSGPGSAAPTGPAAMVLGVMAIGMCLAGVALLVFGIWWIVLICLYRGRFAHAHNAALGQARPSGQGMSTPQQAW